jgi:hypothetical protein
MKTHLWPITVALLLAISTGAAERRFAMQSRVAPPISKAAPKSSSAPAVVPYTIHVPDAVLADLKSRLAHARLADELPGVGWDYGMNPSYLKELVAYWRDRFDWRAQERRLNRLPQFKTNIDGLDIHFIHVRSKNPGALPLLLLNGWPSTIDEYSKVIGPLTDPARFGGRAEDSGHGYRLRRGRSACRCGCRAHGRTPSHRLRRRRPGRRHGDDGVQLRAEHEAADDWL